MCLIFISVNNHPTYKLVVAANRDEFYNRKTAPAHFWSDHPEILAGRDLEAGGTWMGISKSGKISMVTNYRDLKNLKQNAPSRGHLVSEFLLNGDKPDAYLKSVAQKGSEYNGYNLIVGSAGELYYYSNYKEDVERVPDGLHGLSNHLLNTPWPKVTWGIKRMEHILTKNKINTDELFDLLYNDQRANDDQLPDTGIGLERERALSSMFIKSPNYGSRSSTVILVDKQNHVLFKERVYDLTTFDFEESTFELQF